MNDKQYEAYKERARRKLLKFLEDTRKPLPENPDHGCFVTALYDYSNRYDDVFHTSDQYCRDCNGDRGLAEAKSRIVDDEDPLAHWWEPLNELESIHEDRVLRVEYRENEP